MAKVPVYNINGSKIEEMELNDDIFGVAMNKSVLHSAVLQYLANQRQGTQSAKTRAEVRGGGRKPWRQKGTGRARQGSIRSPQWKGGGVVFAPKPRSYSFKLNRKVKRLALKCALSSKVASEKLMVLNDLNFGEVKTKQMVKVVENLKLRKALIVLDSPDKNIVLSTRNIPNIETVCVNTLNAYDIMKYDTFVVTKEAVSLIQEVYA
jgi:large subunit ribosomal protein L4